MPNDGREKLAKKKMRVKKKIAYLGKHVVFIAYLKGK